MMKAMAAKSYIQKKTDNGSFTASASFQPWQSCRQGKRSSEEAIA